MDIICWLDCDELGVCWVGGHPDQSSNNIHWGLGEGDADRSFRRSAPTTSLLRSTCKFIKYQIHFVSQWMNGSFCALLFAVKTTFCPFALGVFLHHNLRPPIFCGYRPKTGNTLGQGEGPGSLFLISLSPSSSSSSSYSSFSSSSFVP